MGLFVCIKVIVFLEASVIDFFLKILRVFFLVNNVIKVNCLEDF